MKRNETLLSRWLGAMTVGLGFLLPATPLTAQDKDDKIAETDPEVERRSFQMADGFEVNLFAADPLLAKPIQMNFDSAGRLWVACSEIYPQIKPGQTANDKIIVLEDRDGDGKADKTTVFADGLLIPTGIEPGDGGVYVAASTELLHLRDTDGDGKADRQRVVLSGFGTEDTHHLLHTLRWGPDGMLYFNQSIYIHSHLETPHGVRRLGGGGVWQFRPETMDLEVFARGFCNPWGHHFDRWGQSFVTDGAYFEGINYVVPGAYYATAPGAVRVVPGLNPGSPKHCGLEILSGRHLPEDWRGNLVTNDFRGHRVCRFVARPDGSGYSSQEKSELIKTAHPAFRPIDVKMGPDGAIYIADWYNPIINHGEVDFRDPRRDHVHGRIWRVTAKGRPLVPRPQLVGATTEDLLQALKAPEDWTRHHAKRVLKERGTVVLPALATWVKHADPSDADHEHDLLEALWTYQSLDVVEPNLLATLLNARDYRVRAAATRVAGQWHARLPKPMEMLAPCVADDHPQVRLEAVRSVARIGTGHAVEVAMRALDRPVDQFLDYALWLTARELESSWLPAAQKGQLPFDGKARHMIFALQAVGTPAVVKPLVDLARAGKVPGDHEENVLATIATLGGPQDLGMVFDGILQGSVPADRQTSLLTALGNAARQRNVRPAGDLVRIGKLLAADNDALRAAAARAVGLWKVESLRPHLVDLARAVRGSEGVRQAAVEGLALLGGKASRDALAALATAGTADGRRMAVVALTSVDAEAAAPRAVDLLGVEQAGDPTPVFAAFMQLKNGPAQLATALAGRKLPADTAKIGVRFARSSGREANRLIEALTKAGGLTFGAHTLSPAEMQQMVADVAKKGDPARGEAIFRRSDLACLKCHAIGNAGGQVGPDLSSLGASAPVDYLVESILLPNKAVKENYHALVVTALDGRLFTGVLVRQTNMELVIRNAEDQEVAIPLKSIDEKAMGGSLMPEGLADTLTRAELVDLVRFLSELGKVGPYAIGKARVVRRWQVLTASTEAERLLRRTRMAAVNRSDRVLNWVPAYSKVSGALPLDAVPGLALAPEVEDGRDGKIGFARCQVEATTGGTIGLALNSPAGMKLWVDGTPVEVGKRVEIDLASGTHTLTFAINLGRRQEELRCELDDVSGSAARVRLVGGK